MCSGRGLGQRGVQPQRPGLPWRLRHSRAAAEDSLKAMERRPSPETGLMAWLPSASPAVGTRTGAEIQAVRRSGMQAGVRATHQAKHKHTLQSAARRRAEAAAMEASSRWAPALLPASQPSPHLGRRPWRVCICGCAAAAAASPLLLQDPAQCFHAALCVYFAA